MPRRVEIILIHVAKLVFTANFSKAAAMLNFRGVWGPISTDKRTADRSPRTWSASSSMSECALQERAASSESE
eukprot:8368250-Pyramimonas_sp.AAC.1